MQRILDLSKVSKEGLVEKSLEKGQVYLGKKNLIKAVFLINKH